jgi:prephenate dehydrogenase
MKTQTIAIIGLDRMGLSVALAIKKAGLAVSLIGHDADAVVAREAKDRIAAFDKVVWNLANAVQKADIVVLTTAAADVETTLQVIGTELQAHTLVLDFSPLKQKAIDWAGRYLQQGHYVGAMPVLNVEAMVDGRSAIHSAAADLFRNSVFCLMPSAKADPDAVETAVNFGILLGARPFFVNPQEYDKLIQGLETLPRLTAVALWSTLHQAAGWRDMLRFAGLPFALTTLPLQNGRDIAAMVMDDQPATLHWLDRLIVELQKVRQLVHEGEQPVLEAVATELAHDRQRWVGQRQQNEWDERTIPQVRQRSLGEQMLGGFASRKDEDEA